MNLSVPALSKIIYFYIIYCILYTVRYSIGLVSLGSLEPISTLNTLYTECPIWIFAYLLYPKLYIFILYIVYYIQSDIVSDSWDLDHLNQFQHSILCTPGVQYESLLYPKLYIFILYIVYYSIGLVLDRLNQFQHSVFIIDNAIFKSRTYFMIQSSICAFFTI